MNKALLAVCPLWMIFVRPVVGQDSLIQYHPLSISAAEEVGPVLHGVYNVAQDLTPETTNWDWFDHFGTFINQETVVADHLHLSAGLGGIFEFRKPELVNGGGFASSQYKTFFVGPTQTEARYDLGDPKDPWLKLGVGMFWYKYNPQAYNLGEYLFRSGAYPTTLYTGGYLVLNNTAAPMEGFQGNYHVGNFKADVFLITETNIAPLYDWSLAGVVSYTVGNGLLDLGAGVNFQRLIQVKPSRTTPQILANSYFEYNGQYYAGFDQFYRYPEGFDQHVADSLTAAGSTDAARINALRSQASADSADLNLVDSLETLPDTAPGQPQYHYYTGAATLLMARATLDVKKLFDSDLFGPEDLLLYSEIDVLGLKDYPVYYTKVTQRMPIMVGFNFPGFKFLDLIALQIEYFNSPWMNNDYEVAHQGANIPFFPNQNNPIVSVYSYNDGALRDNVKWSILVKKSVGKKLTFSAQVADDHFHTPAQYVYFGPQYDFNEVTAFKNDWYWMTQISWGI